MNAEKVLTLIDSQMKALEYSKFIVKQFEKKKVYSISLKRFDGGKDEQIVQLEAFNGESIRFHILAASCMVHTVKYHLQKGGPDVDVRDSYKFGGICDVVEFDPKLAPLVVNFAYISPKFRALYFGVNK